MKAMVNTQEEDEVEARARAPVEADRQVARIAEKAVSPAGMSQWTIFYLRDLHLWYSLAVVDLPIAPSTDRRTIPQVAATALRP